MLSPVRLVAATRNADKIAQLAALTGELATVEPLPSGASLSGSGEELEAGDDLGSIAAAKAVAWSKCLHVAPPGIDAVGRSKADAASAGPLGIEMPGCATPRGHPVPPGLSTDVGLRSAISDGVTVIASDGGLLIPALGERWNPARTRRFAGTGATDSDRAHALLELAGGLVGEARAIGWRETVAIARDGSLLAEFAAESEPGLLATELDEAALARGRGFWIPALWRCPALGGRLLADLTAEERERLDDHWRRLQVPVRAWLRDYSASRS